MSSTAHQQLAHVCVGNPGVGVRLSLIEKGITSSLAAAAGTSLPVPTTNIAFTVVSAAVGAPLGNLPSSNQLELRAVAVELSLHERGAPSKQFSSMSFSFDSILAIPIVDSGGRIILGHKQAHGGSVSVSGQPTQELLDDHFNGSLEEYKLFEYMFRFNAMNEVPAVILSALRLPVIHAALGAIKLVQPTETILTDDYLVLTGKGFQVAPPSPDCPKGGDAEEEIIVRPPAIPAVAAGAVDPQAVEAGAEAEEEQEHSTTTTIEHNAPETAYYSWSEPLVALYLPEQTLLEFTGGAVRPSLTTRDGGTFIAYWEYEASITLDDFRMILDPGLPGLLIEASFDLYGRLSAGIRIGCITIEAIGAKVSGWLSGVDVELTPTIGDNKLRLQSRLRRPVDVDIRVQGSFPVGMILAPLIDSILTFLVRLKVTRLLNSLRVDLLSLRPFGLARPTPTIVSQSVAHDSVVYGLRLSGDD